MIKQKGSVIIIVLWTSILLTVLVTVMAAKVQLSAKTAFHNQLAVNTLTDIASAMNKAEMELMLELMDEPIDQPVSLDEEGNNRSSRYRLNGQALTLNYPAGDNVVVRIYDHAGKINLNRIRRQSLQEIIEKQLGDDPDNQLVQELLSAWTDWTDLNDLAGINGAERDYYESLDPPYSPRNSPELDSVEELRLIRGFDELFKDVNLDAAFTIYGNGQTVNLNLATREAMALLPGLNDEMIEAIIAYREVKDLRNKGDVGTIIPVENFVQLSNWIGNNASTVFSVFAYPKPASSNGDSEIAEDEAVLDETTQAHMEVWEVRSYANRARVYQVNPYGRLPDTSRAGAEDAR
jgi:general secretion pathway protein K